MTRKLLSETINDKSYAYINYGIESKSTTSVDGLIVPINSEIKKQLITVTGFYRDLLEPLLKDENNSINQIVILSVTTTGMAKLTGFFFDNGNDEMELSLTKEPNIVRYFEKYIQGKNVPCQSINSLRFLKTQTNPRNFSTLLKYYYNPKSVDDIGFEIDGQPLHYGQTVFINNVQSLIEKYDNLKQGKLGLLNVNKIELNIYPDGPKIMSSIGEGLLYDQNDEIVSSLKYYCIEEIEGDFEEFSNQCEMESIHICALQANEEINKRPHKKDSIIQECVQRIERELKENKEPYYETIGIGFLLASIKENLVTLK